MSMSASNPRLTPMKLEFPQSLAVYDDYAAAQRTVDYLADHDFPVQNCMIVGTDLKQFERITGRLTVGRVALAGAMSGLWMGLFVGLVLSLFSTGTSTGTTILSSMLFGLLFFLVWALIGYAFTRGRRDFSSVKQVMATKYEVLVEHKVAAQARELLAGLPGALPNPFE
ncbi:general stress protein [Nocardioides insulae]|uniref:general stress protein n=1 Tax=Nocardioides insulae TaxID=394734 RepID=UPI000420DDA1|nr:general stress protein [Nocardioides insulae]